MHAKNFPVNFRQLTKISPKHACDFTALVKVKIRDGAVLKHLICGKVLLT